MKSLLRASLGVGTVLTLLAGPALAQPYHDGYGHMPAHAAPYHEDGWWQHERHQAMWRDHERHDGDWRGYDHDGYGHPPCPWRD